MWKYLYQCSVQLYLLYLCSQVSTDDFEHKARTLCEPLILINHAPYQSKHEPLLLNSAAPFTATDPWNRHFRYQIMLCGCQLNLSLKHPKSGSKNSFRSGKVTYVENLNEQITWVNTVSAQQSNKKFVLSTPNTCTSSFHNSVLRFLQIRNIQSSQKYATQTIDE